MEIPFGNPWDWVRDFARDQNRSGLDFTAGNGLLSGKGPRFFDDWCLG
jgi:hypothetical protein